MSRASSGADGLFASFLLTEAINSVAMEHVVNCDCLVCRAAHGDREALGEILVQLTR